MLGPSASNWGITFRSGPSKREGWTAPRVHVKFPDVVAPRGAVRPASGVGVPEPGGRNTFLSGRGGTFWGSLPINDSRQGFMCENMQLVVRFGMTASRDGSIGREALDNDGGSWGTRGRD